MDFNKYHTDNLMSEYKEMYGQIVIGILLLLTSNLKHLSKRVGV